MPVKRRKFVASEVPVELIVVPSGVYSGILSTSISSKNGSLLRIQEKRVWEKGEASTVKGEWELTGSLMLSCVLTSKKALSLLSRDEPQVRGFMNLNFKEEKDEEGVSYNELVASPAFGQLLSLLNLTDVDLESEMDFEEDEDISIPEGMEEITGIVQLLNDKAYYETLFVVISNYANNFPVCVKVFDKEPRGRNKGKIGNGILVDNNALGIASYIDGSEEDLED